MTHLITIPKLGLTMTDCTLVEWLKNDGDRVDRGDTLFAIETDKITSEIEADGAGYLRRFAEGDSVHVIGSVIGGLYETSDAALAATATAAAAAAAVEVAPALAKVEDPKAAPDAPVAAQAGPRIRVSPLARRIAKDAGIDPAGLTGTGGHGAILRRDVDAEITRRKDLPAPRAAPAPPRSAARR